MNKKDFLQTIVGRYNKYSDGYNLSNAGYVSVITLHTSIMDHQLSSVPEIIDLSKIYEINAFDLAEATGPYMGQINMITVSSFSGPMGFIWGLDIAINDAFNERETKPILTISDPNEDKDLISIFSADPLIISAYELFGTEQKKHFPLFPGSHVPCVNSFYYSKKADKYVFSAVGIGIPEDRTKNADLFMQYANGVKKNMSEDVIRSKIIKSIAESVIEVGVNQKVKYKKIYVEVEIKKVPPEKCGCAFTAIPYILLAKDSIPHQKLEMLPDISLHEWKELVEDKILDR